MPIIVRPPVSKVMVATTGRPASCAPRIAASQLVLREHGLDPRDVGTALAQRLGLFVECFLGLRAGSRAERLEHVARGAHRPGDHHLASRLVGDIACELPRRRR